MSAEVWSGIPEETRICLELPKGLDTLKEAVSAAAREAFLQCEPTRSEQAVLAAMNALRKADSSRVAVADKAQRAEGAKHRFLHD